MSTVPYIIEETSRGKEVTTSIPDCYLIELSFGGGCERCNCQFANCAIVVFWRDKILIKDIKLYINSPGGSVTAGFAIFDTMNYIKCDVSTICIGLAASFGAFLLAAGTKGKRFALPNAEIMIHQPAVSGSIKGSASDIKIMSDHMQKNKQRLNQFLAKNTGRTIEEIERNTERIIL